MVDDIWHAGEVALQRRIGAEDKMAEIGKKVIRGYMPEQHRTFFRQLPFIVVGAVDHDGNVWAGIRSGVPGFIDSPNPQQLRIFGTGMSDDPMEAGIKKNTSVGLLGIELHTRRRNRMNGSIQAINDEWVDIHVEQSFGNCPKYIRERRITSISAAPSPITILGGLDTKYRSLIESSETFFIASYADVHDQRQVDVSHRGGAPGFVSVDKNGLLTIPDFIGNNFFATLGNIHLNSRAGLTFIDFSGESMLQMTGIANILSTDEVGRRYEGAQRFWQFSPQKIFYRHLRVNG